MVTAIIRKMLAEYAKWQELSKKGKTKSMMLLLKPKWKGSARRLEMRKMLSAVQRQARRWLKTLDIDLMQTII